MFFFILVSICISIVVSMSCCGSNSWDIPTSFFSDAHTRFTPSCVIAHVRFEPAPQSVAVSSIRVGSTCMDVQSGNWNWITWAVLEQLKLIYIYIDTMIHIYIFVVLAINNCCSYPNQLQWSCTHLFEEQWSTAALMESSWLNLLQAVELQNGADNAGYDSIVFRCLTVCFTPFFWAIKQIDWRIHVSYPDDQMLHVWYYYILLLRIIYLNLVSYHS